LLAAQVGLLAIYLSSTMVRTLLRGFTFTGFETAQLAAAFLISVSGGLKLSNADPRLAAATGILTLACAAACYAISFVILDGRGLHGRNFYTYSTFGLLLTLVGSRILAPGDAAQAMWAALALAGAWAGGAFGRMTLRVHGAIYLVLALLGAGALREAGGYVMGSAAWPGERTMAVAAGTVVAGICYALARRHCASWPFRLAMATVFAWMIAGVLAGAGAAAYHAAGGPEASHAYCASIRTAVLAGGALLLGWAGSRGSDPELARLIYPVMLLGAYRLVALDLRQDRTPALVLSLLVYGAALIVVPRVARRVG
jgi:hypothetical protein